MLVKDNFYITFKNNYNKIKIILDLYRVYRYGTGIFNLELINESFTNIVYLDKNDISTNLININTNEDNIAFNLSEIDYIKNNISKQYLKYIYNILFYNKKTKIDFKNIFYEKVFDIDSKQNDFIEMNFKISLEYEDISERNYVRTISELFDETNDILYVKSIFDNEYPYFSNNLIIDENVFYNFTKDIKKIKFVIKFQMILPKVIKIWYIKNENYRLVIKNYGL